MNPCSWSWEGACRPPISYCNPSPGCTVSDGPRVLARQDSDAHILRAHWPLRGLEQFVTSSCRNDTQDFDETGVDIGPNCPGTLRGTPRLSPPAVPPISDPGPCGARVHG
ncbi:hypothetical protein [Vitiosangium sp. GDMCC 1.1324]|uniref:hypothetical protein n=1 Tax=Vitiosangium sp. (strain GDMCC 1.1324) TaxID=2138576 RepID=UPI0011B3D5FE|nr:hypothetical protein [Vitiosangium sp. GDMCC 1.1324]